jgi:hypothetical protein
LILSVISTNRETRLLNKCLIYHNYFTFQVVQNKYVLGLVMGV